MQWGIQGCVTGHLCSSKNIFIISEGNAHSQLFPFLPPQPWVATNLYFVSMDWFILDVSM